MKVSISKSYISLIGLEEEEIRYYLRDFAFKVEFYFCWYEIFWFSYQPNGYMNLDWRWFIKKNQYLV